MKKLFSLTLSLLMLIACSLGTVSAFAAEGEEPTPVDLRQKGRLLRRSPQCGTEYRHPSLHRVDKERDQVRHQFKDPVEQGNLLRL